MNYMCLFFSCNLGELYKFMNEKNKRFYLIFSLTSSCGDEHFCALVRERCPLQSVTLSTEPDTDYFTVSAIYFIVGEIYYLLSQSA